MQDPTYVEGRAGGCSELWSSRVLFSSSVLTRPVHHNNEPQIESGRCSRIDLVIRLWSHLLGELEWQLPWPWGLKGLTVYCVGRAGVVTVTSPGGGEQLMTLPTEMIKDGKCGLLY